MSLTFSDEKPIFLQIAAMLENAISSGAYAEEGQIPSITELAVAHKINPATALKGINVLVDEGLLYKKRGLGMFVAAGAKAKVLQKRKENFYRMYIKPMIREAGFLGISSEVLKEMIERGYRENGN